MRIIGLASSKNNVPPRRSEDEEMHHVSEVEISSRPSGSEYFSFIESLSPAGLYIRAVLTVQESPQGPLDLHRSFMASELCSAYRQQEGYGIQEFSMLEKCCISERNTIYRQINHIRIHTEWM